MTATTHYWLMKSEPDEFSIDDLSARNRNPGTACAIIRRATSCATGCGRDGVFFYHSSCAEPGVVGVAEVATEAHPDPTQFDPKSDYFDAASTRDEPRWLLVDVKFKKLKRVIPLTELKSEPALPRWR